MLIGHTDARRLYRYRHYRHVFVVFVRLLTVLLSPRQTADKRKAMLDELAIEMAQEKSRHKEEVSDVRLQHEKEVLGIRARYEKELRGLHEEKSRTEEEIRAQLREEKVGERRNNSYK